MSPLRLIQIHHLSAEEQADPKLCTKNVQQLMQETPDVTVLMSPSPALQICHTLAEE